MNEWCIYIALFVYCCTPKALYNHVGGGGVSPLSHSNKCDHFHCNLTESIYHLTMVQSTHFSSVEHAKGLDVERTDPTHESFLHRVLISISFRVQPVDFSLSFLELLYMLTNAITKLSCYVQTEYLIKHGITHTFSKIAVWAPITCAILAS